ncbi:MAG: hypothetical protein KA791_05840 [Flavobacteriales bacterium]|nr:hypothetical protein [Flavobacteriales bacterium]
MQERHFRLALLVLGHGVFIALLALAWEHAMIRSTFGDTAFQVFQWVGQPGWDIEAHRYTAIVPQACVKFFALFGPDLRALLVVASLAHVLVGYVIFFLCAHVWRSPVAAFGCALAAVLCSRLAFYSPVLEANYLLCYPFLLVGFVEHRTGTDGSTPLASAQAGGLLLIPLIVHPAGWMVMLFCVAFMAILGWLRGGLLAVLLALNVAWPLIARWLFPPTAYEQEQYGAIADGLQNIGSFAKWGSSDFLAIHTFSASTTYLPALLVLFAVLAGWIFLRQRWAALATLGGVSAFLLAYLVTFHAGNSAVMQDRGVLPVASIISLSASALLARLDRHAWRPTTLILLTIVLFVKVRDVSFASRPFKEQMTAVEAFIHLADEQGIARGIVDHRSLHQSGVEDSWAFPVETLLRSAARGPEHSRILVCSDRMPPADEVLHGEIPVLQFRMDAGANGNRYFGSGDPSYRTVVQP